MNYIHTDIPEGMTAAEYRRECARAESHAIRRAVVAIAAALVLTAILTAIATMSASAATLRPEAHAVALSDAERAPSALALLLPHASVTYAHGRAGYNCPRGYFTDVSAYQWNGGALAPQRWDRIGVAYWNYGHGHHGRVTFNGVTFTNEGARPVLVAGWCES